MAQGPPRAVPSRLDLVLDAVADAVTVHDETGRTIYANDAAVRLLGAASREEVLTSQPGELARRFIITCEDGTPVRAEDFPGRHAVAGEPAPPLLTRSVQRTTGRVYWLLTKASVVRGPDGRLLAVNIIEDVTEAKQAERRQRFLAEAGAVLARSLDYRETLERVARLVVPQLADWCAIDVVDDRGTARRVAVVAAEGAAPDDPPALRAPMRLGERTIGFIALGGRGRSFSAADAAVFEQLGVLAATAVENARLYTERRVASETLQRSLLPERLPDPPGWRCAGWYQPGAPGVEVGGDFYDVFSAGDEYVALLGDVTGKGVQAAALTALVRHTARAAALFDSRPTAVLALLDRVLRDQPSPALVTVVCARLEDGGMVTVASGGHPLPLRAGAAGGAAAVGVHGLLLGAEPSAEWAESPVRLVPGDTLLLYSDGITDTPGAGGRFGEERLARLVADAPRDPGAMLDALAEAVHAFQTEATVDDRAMLAVQYVG